VRENLAFAIARLLFVFGIQVEKSTETMATCSCP
jgi:hypothetical protein